MVLKRYFWLCEYITNSKKERENVIRLPSSTITSLPEMKRANKIATLVILKSNGPQTQDSDTSAHNRFHSDHHPFPLDTRSEIFCFSLRN